MEQLNETARVDRELEQTQHDLRETLEQINHQVETRWQPQAIMRSNPVVLPFLEGLLGFFAGSNRPFRWVTIGASMIAALATGHRGSNNGSDQRNK